MPRLLALGLTLALAPTLPAADDGPTPLFNGKDLSGWVNVNCAPGTFVVKGGEVVTTGQPTGFLRTEKQYENFVLDVDWMHVEPTKMANSGIFVWGDPLPAVGTPYTRGIEVQVLINYKTDWATSHGDLFSIWGATCVPDRPHPKGYARCLPSEERVKGAGQWNHYTITANDGVVKLAVNGKEVSGVSKCNPRKGYLALESEGAECHFKNLRIKELPSTNPKPEEVAKLAEGHASLFNGLDLTGWKTDKDAWKAANGKLAAAGKADLVSDGKYGPCELVFDWKTPAKSDAKAEVVVGGVSVDVGTSGAGAYWTGPSTGTGSESRTSTPFAKAGAWNRAVVRLDGTAVVVSVNDREVHRAEKPVVTPGPISFKPADGREVMNVFIRKLEK